MSGISINREIDDITPDDSVSRGSEDIVTKKRNRPSGKTIPNTIQYKRWPKCGEHVTIIEEPSNIPEECYENDSDVESEFEERNIEFEEWLNLPGGDLALDPGVEMTLPKSNLIP